VVLDKELIIKNKDIPDNITAIITLIISNITSRQYPLICDCNSYLSYSSIKNLTY
jgi:hypothetical protein